MAALARWCFQQRRRPPGYWTSCSDPASPMCLARLRVYHTTNKYEPALLCGMLEFAWRSPSPSVSGIADRPALVALGDVSCP
jgi:hypothetical protein